MLVTVQRPEKKLALDADMLYAVQVTLKEPFSLILFCLVPISHQIFG